jgi:alanyl-tRNA synthetase
MTERLYLNSDALELNTTVLTCSPTDDGQFAIVLASTIFHPQGGGQPSDKGTIGQANVIAVKHEDNAVIHLCDRSVPVGNVEVKVCPATRLLHARLHSAGHIIGQFAEQFGWKAVKAHHWPGEARVVVEPSAETRVLDSAEIQSYLNQAIASDWGRVITQEGDRRAVGFADQLRYPCGGTHVRSTREIGEITITKIKEKRGQTSIHYAVVD